MGETQHFFPFFFFSFTLQAHLCFSLEWVFFWYTLIYMHIYVCVCALNYTIFTSYNPGFNVPALLSCSVFRNLPFLQVSLQTWVGAATHFTLILPILKDLVLCPPCLVRFISFTHITRSSLLHIFFQRSQQTLHLTFSFQLHFFFPFPILSDRFFINCWIKLQFV